MKKIEASTLEEAYKKASQALECSISELDCEVLQYPSKGLLGFFKKNAIIVVTRKHKNTADIKNKPNYENVSSPRKVKKPIVNEHAAVVKEEKIVPDVIPVEVEMKKEDVVINNFFEVKHMNIEEKHEEESIVYDELARLIEAQLTELLSHSCFEIDVVEVDVRDNTALIFIDGNDAALLIGKEGYRYNALSYMLFNWLHAKYELFIKLEIAEFLTSQQEMIRNYIKPVIENVEKHGKGKTRFLDGILVQIALEQLRERFPDKYVAVKTGKEGKKFVVINEFNHKHA